MKLFKLFITTFLFLGLSTSNIFAAENKNAYMKVTATVSAKRNYGFGTISNDTPYYGSVTTTIESTIGYQTFSKKGAASGLGGAYVYVYPEYSNYTVKRAKSDGRVIINGKNHDLSTSWQN